MTCQTTSQYDSNNNTIVINTGVVKQWHEVVSVIDSLIKQDNILCEQYSEAACQAGSFHEDHTSWYELETSRQAIKNSVIRIKEVEVENKLKDHKIEELKQKVKDKLLRTNFPTLYALYLTQLLFSD